jgi:GMP synthase-like glutamine amidotransferase
MGTGDDNMILIINVCKEKLHFLEFVKPVCDILEDNKIKYFILDYKLLKLSDFKKCSKIIICGTSLFDNKFIKDIRKFEWIKNTDKSILGICAGMQIIGAVYGAKLIKKTEIGYYSEDFIKEFLCLSGDSEVYHLHNYYADFSKLKDFESYSSGEINQAVKHKNKSIYAVLFHPEVRNKNLILEFITKRD